MGKLLQGYTSQDNAYHVGDYPYGFKLRTDIYYWIEFKEGKGYRFGSVTRNPKTDRMNKPKYSTYACVLGFMYLNDEGHVTLDRIHEYSSSTYISETLARFPELPRERLRAWCQGKVALYSMFAQQGKEPYRNTEGKTDLELWQATLAACG